MEDLLAGDLGGHRPRGQIRELVLGKQPGALRHAAGNGLRQKRAAVAGLGGDHEGIVEGELFVQPVGQRQEPGGRHQVDLVEHQEFRSAALRQAGNHPLVVGLDAFLGVDQQERQVGIGGTGPGGIDHRPVEPPARLENTGRVDIHHLGLAIDGDADDPPPGGLHLGRDDRHLGTDQAVEQGRLADIGGTQDGDEACPGHGGNRSSRRRAAACSPARLEPAAASSLPLSPRVTRMVKVGACGGPFWSSVR